MADTATSESITDLAGTIVVDLACWECDYNLRGLSTEGLCPECGFEIEVSTEERLRPSPFWTRPANLALTGWVVALMSVAFLPIFLIAVAVEADAFLLALGWLILPPASAGPCRRRRIRRKAIIALILIGLFGVACVVGIHIFLRLA